MYSNVILNLKLEKLYPPTSDGANKLGPSGFAHTPVFTDSHISTVESNRGKKSKI